MKNELLIRSLGDGNYQWYRDGVVAGSGPLDQLSGDNSSRLWLLLPGQQVKLSELPCPAKERRHLRQAAPYELEEQLIGGIDDLHFAFTRPVDDLVTAACCDRDWLAAQIEPFGEAGLELHHISIEPLALPYSGGWTLCMVDDHLWVRYGDSLGFSLELSLAAVALQQLLSERGMPEQVMLLLEDEQQSDGLQQYLPEQVAGLCQVIVQPLAETLTGEQAAAQPALDLRQADFSNHLPVKRWWQQWRKVAVLAGIVFAVFAVAQFIQYTQLQQHNKVLQQQLSAEVGKVFSRAVPGNPEQQLNSLRSKLRELGGSSNGNSVVAVLADVMPVLSQAKGVQLRNFSFNGKTGELRLSSWAPSFDHLQQLQSQLTARQLDAKLVDSSADGDGQRGDFRVRKISGGGE